MINRRQFASSALGILFAGSLVACGGGGQGSQQPADQNTDANASASSSQNAQGNAAGTPKAPEEVQTLVVAALPTPHAVILQEFAAPRLEQRGIALEVREVTDRVQTNAATVAGEVDANYLQNTGALNSYNKENDADLKSAGLIHYDPFGVYSRKHDRLSSIAQGATVAIPNDPANEGRALLLLQQEGIIKLSDPNSLTAVPDSIADNPKEIEFQELDAAALPRALDDADYAVLGNNLAADAGLHVLDALVVEANDSRPVAQYASIICTRADKLNDERIVALVEVLQSDDFAQYLQQKYGQDVLPAV